MQQASLFINSFRALSTWKIIFFTTLLFYILGVVLLRFDSILSLFRNLGFWDTLFPFFTIIINPLNTFSPLSLVVFLVTSILFALHIVALRLYTQKRFYTKGQNVSLFGVLSSLLGCLACCGSVLLSAIIGFVGLSLSSLPFNGQEIGFIGLFISLVSLVYTVRKIDTPLTC